MGSVFVFAGFITCVIVSLVLGISMVFPLIAGYLLFTAYSCKNGYRFRDILRVSVGSFRESFIVVSVLLLIGCLTGLWRISGTVASFVCGGIKIMPSSLFVLSAFLLSALMSYAIGTSFGVTATAGVILISIARVGGVAPLPVAGAVMSGVYVGDRGSPAASSANLVAAVTGTDMRRNIREMAKTGLVPFLVCCAIYAVISAFFPLENRDTELITIMESEFRLGAVCLLPAAAMIVLPFCGMKVKHAMAVSIVISFALTVLYQGKGFGPCFKAMLLGYEPENSAISDVLSGGGAKSMLEVCVILLISGTYGAIFQETGMLSSLSSRISALSSRIGRFKTMALLSVGACAVFCNQTIGIIMVNQLSCGLYGDSETEKNSKMIDLEDSVITIAGLIPWCIACSVPASMMGTGAKTILFAFYLWIVPLWTALRRGNEKLYI